MASDPDDLDPASLARAEAALAALSDRYLEWAEADLARMELCLADILSCPGHQDRRLSQLFTIVHDMKGQGETFGYPLVSQLGNALCRLLETSPQPGSAEMNRAAALASAMGRVIRERLSGDGGEDGQRLRELL